MLSDADKKILLLPIEQAVDRVQRLMEVDLFNSSQLVHELEKDAKSFLSTFQWFLHNNGEMLEFADCEILVRHVVSELNERLRGLN